MVYHPKSVRQMGVSSAVSDSFFVTNGVRQGGILSPLLFNVYMDGLSSSLSNTRTGCSVSFHIGAFCFDARQFGAFHFGDFHFDPVPVRRVSQFCI